ncbi:MAG: type II toxin-antitoxin system RelE/ParE family toxin [Gammaproteobacteria bacterium]|nr:type II toxin-antitoxin system RelE/ParE family toxin [Gammaproteobacteria bacterium]
MIQSFKDRNTQRFFEGHRIAAFQGFARQAMRRLAYLNDAESFGDLAALPGNRLEMLGGRRRGQYSIRINMQWRICFRWGDKGPCGVEIVDYH